MKKLYLSHLIFLVSFFVLITIFKKWFGLQYLPFWVGGMIGIVLPDLDHLIYVYFLRPQDLTSQKATDLISKRQFKAGIGVLSQTMNERQKLIFHTAFFQITFLLFAFWVVSSSGNLLGHGIVLAFFLHLLVDQFNDLMEKGTLENWFVTLRLSLTKEKATLYWLGNVLLLLLMGFVF